jgi:iron complex outermembrane recepter protein
MRNLFHRHLISASVLAVSATLAPPVFAQATAQNEAAAPQPEAADNGDTIIVTGSRIANPSATSASPLQIVGAEQIQQSGATNVQDLLLENPAFGTPGISRTNSSFATQSAGVATVDLRNLGSDRTLTLVNGRRFVAGVPGSSAVDLNVIPTQFLERVDVLTGGASAVYGSDAVAGVVNFIYKTKFEGIEADAKVGISDRGDGRDREVNLLVGKNFADGRGNIMLFGGYSKQGTVLKRDRFTQGGSSAVDSTSRGGSVTGNAAELFTPQRPFLSGFNPRGRYYTDNNVFTFGRDGALRNCVSTNGTAGCVNADGSPAGADGFNRSDFRYLAVPVERYVAAGRGNFEFSPAFNVFVEGNYAKTKVTTQIEPFPLASDDIKGFVGDTPSGQIPIESRVAGVLYRNPYVPNAIFNDSSDSDGDGLRDIFFDKRLADFGNRTSAASRDLFRVAGGINGKFGANEQFSYEAYGIYGETIENQTSGGQFNGPRFRQALSAIRDVNDLNGNGNRTEIICADAAARAAGCIPANPFGAGSLTPAAAYLAVPTSLRSKITQTVAGANVSGNLFSLFGADPVGVSIGGEYRRETSTNDFDLLTQQGLNGGNALPSTRGSFNVKEAYGEAIVPLLADRPFFNSLSVRGAVRVSDYNTIGTTFSYNYGGEWSPVKDVRFRAIWARSVRAPNINELFAPPQQDFPSGIQDPCAGITATTAGTLATNCRAAPGVNANIAANGRFTLSQADVQGITSFAGGNLRLQEEKGDSFTAGVVINPRSIQALRNFTLTVDYFNIRIRDAIVQTPLQFILDQCYNGANTALCSLVVRRPAAVGANSSGSLDEVNSAPTNSGGVKTSGIDAVLTWVSPRNAIGFLPGSFSARASYTHLISGFQVPLPGADRDYFAGEIGAAKDRFTTSLGYDDEAVGFNMTGTYVGASYIDDQLANSFTDANNNPIPRNASVFRVSPEFYLDAQVRFKVQKRFEFYLGADNLLDNKPPYLADVGASAGQDTDAGTYDALGRRYYAGVRVKF